MQNSLVQLTDLRYLAKLFIFTHIIYQPQRRFAAAQLFCPVSLSTSRSDPFNHCTQDTPMLRNGFAVVLGTVAVAAEHNMQPRLALRHHH